MDGSVAAPILRAPAVLISDGSFFVFDAILYAASYVKMCIDIFDENINGRVLFVPLLLQMSCLLCPPGQKPPRMETIKIQTV